MSTAERTIPPVEATQEVTLSQIFLDNLYDAGRNRGEGWWSQYRSYRSGGRHRSGLSANEVAHWLIMSMSVFLIVGVVFILLAVLT